MSAGGAMAGIAQINLRELPYVPEALADVALLTLFIDVSDGELSPPSDAPNGDRWLIRAYGDLADLRPVDGVTAPAVKPFPLRWERTDADVPSWEDAVSVLSAAELDAVGDDYDELIGRPEDGLKVGGWPTLIQGEITWAHGDGHPARPEFVLQVDSDVKTGLAWGDAGVLYIGRGATDRDVWVLEWQCM